MFFKPYPTNHFTQAGIDAALELRRRGLRPDDLADVELGYPQRAADDRRAGGGEGGAPNGYTARFSGPFTFATALAGGGGLGVYLDDFTDEVVRDERRLALARRVRCVADPDATRSSRSSFRRSRGCHAAGASDRDEGPPQSRRPGEPAERRRTDRRSSR